MLLRVFCFVFTRRNLFTMTMNVRREYSRRSGISSGSGNVPNAPIQHFSVSSDVPWAARPFCKRALEYLQLQNPMLTQRVKCSWDTSRLLSASLKPGYRYELLNFDGDSVYIASTEQTLREALSSYMLKSEKRVYGILITPLNPGEKTVSLLLFDKQGRHITAQM